jgi:hypothetical protein
MTRGGQVGEIGGPIKRECAREIRGMNLPPRGFASWTDASVSFGRGRETDSAFRYLPNAKKISRETCGIERDEVYA